MGRRKNQIAYWVAPGGTLWHLKQDCPVLVNKGKPEKIGSMEIGCRGLQPCRCAHPVSGKDHEPEELTHDK